MLDLRNLLASVAKTNRPEDLDKAISDARLEGFRADAEIERLTNERLRILREESDATLEKHDATIAATKRQRERVDAAIAELERQAGELAERQAEAERRKRYDETVRERSAVAKLLRLRYPELAGEIAEILERLGSLESRIEQVNKDLPAGAAPLEEVEYPLRRSPGRAEPFEPLRRAVNLPNLTGGCLNIWPADQIR